MNQPTPLLAVLPLLALLAPAVRADHRESSHARRQLLLLADEVTDAARLAHRTAVGRHGRHGRYDGRAPGRRHGAFAPRDPYALTALAQLEASAYDFERALKRHPVFSTHREYETLLRAFDRAAVALYRAPVGPALARDFECLAEYMVALSGTYEEIVYPRGARYRGDPRRFDGRIGVYSPRRGGEWRPGWRGWNRGWR